MDGTLAAIFLITGLTDMGLNHCQTGCLAPNVAQSRFSLQAAAVEFQGSVVGQEVYLGVDLAQANGPFQRALAVSLTDTGDAWAGYGVKWRSEDVIGGPIFVETSLLPGIYIAGDGPDIGGALQFRSAVGLGYTFANGASLTASYDHRSNADTQAVNPGLETISLRYSIDFN